MNPFKTNVIITHDKCIPPKNAHLIPPNKAVGFNDFVHCLQFQPWQADVQVDCMHSCFWTERRQIAAWHGVVHL